MRALTVDRSFVVSKDVNGDLRTKFKNVIFGLAYGAGTSRIAELLNIGQYEAQIVYNAIYEEIPGAVDWLESKADEAIRTGRVVFNDVTGNYRLFPNYQDKSFENSIRREAKNCGIQGTNADMIKDGMIQVDRLLKRHNSKGWIILQVYDELFIQYEEKVEFSSLIQNVLDTTCNKYLKNGVKMVSEFSLGNSWIK
jgi:DNA polymerase-1